MNATKKEQKMPETKQTNTVLVNALVNALKDADLRIKGTSLESICAAHLHNSLRHEILVRVYGCRPGAATKILKVLNELVPRDTNEGANEMSTKKTATKKPAAKKTAPKKPATKKTAPKKLATKKTAPKKLATKKTPAPKKKKIEKEKQPEQNGRTRPKAGSLIRRVWDNCDTLKKKLQRIPTRKEVMALPVEGLKAVTVGCQYRYWAIFHGSCIIKPRGKKKTPDKKSAREGNKKPARKLPVKKAIKRRPIAKKVKK